MPVSVACTSCGSRLKAPDQLIGRTLKCPKCKAPVAVPATNGPPPAPAQHAPPPVPPVVAQAVTVVPPAEVASVKACPFCSEPILANARKCKHCGELLDPVLRAADESQRAAERRPAQAPVHVTVNAPRNSAASSSLGIASLVLGCLAFVVSLIPLVGLLSMPVAALGLVLGLLGGVIALCRAGKGIGFPIAGVGVSGAALAVAYVWLSALQALFGISQPSPGGDSNPAGAGAAWSDGRQGVRAGDIGVTVGSLEFAEEVNVEPEGTRDSRIVSVPGGVLLVPLSLQHHGLSGQVVYQGWGSKPAQGARLTYYFRADAGGSSEQAWPYRPPMAGRLLGEMPRLVLAPNMVQQEMLYFAAPVRGSVEYAHLELAAENVGGMGSLRILLSKDTIPFKLRWAKSNR